MLTHLLLLPSSYILQPTPRPRCRGLIACAAAPMEPQPELDVTGTIRAICDGLQKNDAPSTDAGVERLYNYLTPMGRVAIAPPPPKNGLQGGVTIDDFLRDAASPALGALIECAKYELVGEQVISPGNEQGTRGRLATQLVEVTNDPLDVCGIGADATVCLQAMARAPDDFLAEFLAATRDGRDPPPTPPSMMKKETFYFSLEEERRPPYIGCWLLKEMMPTATTKLQQLASLGEEFDGDDFDDETD